MTPPIDGCQHVHIFSPGGDMCVVAWNFCLFTKQLISCPNGHSVWPQVPTVEMGRPPPPPSAPASSTSGEKDEKTAVENYTVPRWPSTGRHVRGVLAFEGYAGREVASSRNAVHNEHSPLYPNIDLVRPRAPSVPRFQTEVPSRRRDPSAQQLLVC